MEGCPYEAIRMDVDGCYFHRLYSLLAQLMALVNKPWYLVVLKGPEIAESSVFTAVIELTEGDIMMVLRVYLLLRHQTRD